VPYPFVECYEFLKDKPRFLASFAACGTGIFPAKVKVEPGEVDIDNCPPGRNQAKKARTSESLLEKIFDKMSEPEPAANNIAEMRGDIKVLQGSIKEGVDAYKFQMQMSMPFLSDQEKKDLYDNFYGKKSA